MAIGKLRKDSSGTIYYVNSNQTHYSFINSHSILLNNYYKDKPYHPRFYVVSDISIFSNLEEVSINELDRECKKALFRLLMENQ